ncbi:MAG: DNA polymerase III subunit gamma/tau [Treponema sp.]|nr:DNA polymerase III subunit gamma/tau [Treponema sp.]
MAYEVTATRRRPQKFEDLIGQEFVAATLKNSIQSGKIAHAYLFSGPRGCGKTSTARIFAKALNCQNGPTPSPCGECSACKEITKGSSLDVIEIDGASNTSVNDVRQIKDEVQFPPNSSRYKIYIIDEVHMLSTSAFNALLKTIEEPPEYIIFIFATTELQKVPATIKSRCQQFNFRLVPIEKIKEQLALAASEINIQADDEALYWIARESTGSMRDAYTLFDQVAAFSESHITYEKIRDKLGLVGTDRLNALFEECAQANPSGAEDKLNEFLQAGISIEQLITNSADYLRSLLLIKNGIAKESLLGQDPARFSKAVLDSWTNVQIERALSIFLNLYRDIRYSLSPRYEIDLAFSRLCWLKEYVSPSEVKVAIDQARSLLASAPAGGTPGGNPPGFNQGAENGQSGAPKEFHFASLEQFSARDDAPQQFDAPPFEPEAFSAPAPAAPAAPTEMPTDPDLIKDALISSFSLEDESLASLLKNTGEWTFDGQKICAIIFDAFQKTRIEGKTQALKARMRQLWGKDVLFEVRVVAQEVEEKKEVKIPDEVNLFVKVFKGEIVGGKV